MSDPYKDFQGGLSAPAANIYDITPSNTADLTISVRAISVLTSGTVKITAVGGTTGTVYVVAGAPFPIRAQRVWASDTTATGITGLV